jgi:hypothetical protein
MSRSDVSAPNRFSEYDQYSMVGSRPMLGAIWTDERGVRADGVEADLRLRHRLLGRQQPEGEHQE